MVTVVVMGRLSRVLAGRLLRLALLQLGLEGALLLRGQIGGGRLGLGLEGLLDCVAARRVYCADTHGGFLFAKGPHERSKRYAQSEPARD